MTYQKEGRLEEAVADVKRCQEKDYSVSPDLLRELGPLPEKANDVG